MTEVEYLSSTDPVALRTLLVERGLWRERKCRAFVEVCRWAHNTAREPDSWNVNSGGYGANWVTLAEYWCQLPWNGKIPDPRASFIRDIWGNPWPWGMCVLNDGRGGLDSCAITSPHFGPHFTHGNHEFPNEWDAWLTYRNGLVLALAKAAVTRECPQCKLGKLHTVPTGITGFDKWESWLDCSKCKATGTIPITGPIDPFRLAVLADALEEAGCTDDGILGHLRTTSEKWETSHDFSAGSMCRECGMTYTEHMSRKFGDDRCVRTRPVSHIWTPSGGCWVIDMLAAGSSTCCWLRNGNRL